MEARNLEHCIDYIGRGVPYEYIISNLLCVYIITVKYVVCMYRKVISAIKLRTICDAGMLGNHGRIRRPLEATSA